MKILTRLFFSLLIALALIHYSYGDWLTDSDVPLASFQLAKVVMDNNQSADSNTVNHPESKATDNEVLPEKNELTSELQVAPATKSKPAIINSSQSMQLIPSQKKKGGSSVKITPNGNNHQLNGAPTLLMDNKNRQQYTDRSMLKSGNLLGNKVQVKQAPKKQLIEGYKLNRRGKGTSYVYGEVTKNKKGEVSGYLYDKRGKPTYVYGQSDDENANAGRKANSAEDSGGIYLQDKQHNEYIFDN